MEIYIIQVALKHKFYNHCNMSAHRLVDTLYRCSVVKVSNIYREFHSVHILFMEDLIHIYSDDTSNQN